MAEQTTEIATDADGFKTLPVVLTVDDVDYPVDLARIDARQVVLMRRELAVSPADMIARLDVGQAELPEVVALMVVSIDQTAQARGVESTANVAALLERLRPGIVLRRKDGSIGSSGESKAKLADAKKAVAAGALRKGDVVRVSAGEFIPADGEIIEGVASVDESAITGESAPVIRESGGDRSAVTGGTRVLSDEIVVYR